MDFFKHQDDARRRTALLIVYYIIAVLAVILGVYFAAILTLQFSDAKPSQQLWNKEAFAVVSCITLIVICLGTMFKIIQLGSGGSAVAEALGGRLISPETTAPLEKRLVNVVQEMAIASGIPVPALYILPESGINAFAAGYSPQSAVIGVTEGCLKALNRDELQGVIAHEFSHIFNSDMSLNIRLIGVLHGILVLAVIGRIILRSSSNSHRSYTRSSDSKKGGGGIALFGLLLMIVGYIGVLCANLIKSAISREREFLADSSAVQFTRNPAGIAGALKKIGGLVSGSTVTHPRAEEASHMFFAQGISSFWSGLFSTHPPLEERIKRLDPSFSGEIPTLADGYADDSVGDSTNFNDYSPISNLVSSQSQESRDQYNQSDNFEPYSRPSEVQKAMTQQQVIDQVGNPSYEHLDNARRVLHNMPPELRAAASNPTGAKAIIYCFFITLADADSAHDIVRRSESPACLKELEQIAPYLARLSPTERLPLVELCLGTLKSMNNTHYQVFKNTISALIAADGTMKFAEYILSVIVFEVLDETIQKKRPSRPRYHSWEDLSRQAEQVLSIVSHYGNSEDAKIRSSFIRGARALSTTRPIGLLDADQIDLNTFHQALKDLDLADSQLKAGLIKAVVSCMTADETVTPEETEMLRAVCAALKCPMPLLHA